MRTARRIMRKYYRSFNISAFFNSSSSQEIKEERVNSKENSFIAIFHIHFVETFARLFRDASSRYLVYFGKARNGEGGIRIEICLKCRESQMRRMKDKIEANGSEPCNCGTV